MNRLFAVLLCALFIAAGAAQSAAQERLPPNAPFAAEINAFAESDATTAPARCTLLFVGSSSIKLWQTLADDMAPQPVINRGFGGSQVADINRYFDRVVTPYAPRAIVFYAGDNDIAKGKFAERVVADFKSFMALKERALGTTPVYFIAVKPSKARIAQLGTQERVNEAIRTFADEREDLVFIDVVTAMMENGAPKDIFVEDGLHLSAAGYAIWAKRVRDALSKPLPTHAPGCP